MQKEHIIMLALAGGAVLYFMSNSASAEEGGGGGGETGTINIRVGPPGGTLFVDGEQRAVVPPNGLAALTLAAPYLHSFKIVFADGSVVENNLQIYAGSNPDRYIKAPGDIAGKSYYDQKAAEAIAAGNTPEADAQATFAAANIAASEKRYSDARAGWQSVVDANNNTLVAAARGLIFVLDSQLRTGQKIEGIK
jgi:hypothetical protein